MVLYVSAWYYRCVRCYYYVPACVCMLLYMCPHATIHVSAHRQARAHCAVPQRRRAATRIFVSLCYCTCGTSAQALLLQSVCSHAAICVSSCYYICVRIHRRTGTLIARYLMARCGFKAREAIAWQRVVMPGCVRGGQQQYLTDCEALNHRSPDSLISPGSCAAAPAVAPQQKLDA